MSLEDKTNPQQAILAPNSEPNTPDLSKAKVGYLRKRGIAINNKAGTGLTYPKDVLDLTLEIRKIKRFFNKTADSLKLKEGLHSRPRTGEHDNGSFAGPSLFLKIIVTIRAKLAQIGQAILTFRNTDIKKHAIGFTFFRLLKTLGSVERGQDLIAKKLKLLFDDLTNIILVINHKNTFFLVCHFDLEKVSNIKTIVKNIRELNCSEEILLLA